MKIRLAALSLAAAALVAIAAGAGGPAAASPPAAAPATGITVTGSAVVEARPDRSEWTFGVQTRGETAREALRESSKRVRAVLEALRRAGIARDDLRTEQVSVGLRFDGTAGYAATNAVHAVVRDLDKAGEAVDGAVEAGANEVFGPGLARGEREALYREALARAFDVARANAQALARRAGASLGRVLAIVESGGPQPVVLRGAAPADSAPVPIEPGTTQISAAITVTFELGGR